MGTFPKRIWIRCCRIGAWGLKHWKIIASIGFVKWLHSLAQEVGNAQAARDMISWFESALAFVLRPSLLRVAFWVLVACALQDFWRPKLRPVLNWFRIHGRPAFPSLPQTWTAKQIFKDGMEFGLGQHKIRVIDDTLYIDSPDLRLNEGNRGDVGLGSAGNRILPEYDDSVSFGSPALRYKDGWFTRLHLHQSSVMKISNPPKILELNAAFGEPSALGEGFVAIASWPESGIWLCTTFNGGWHTTLLPRASSDQFGILH
ncbi:MAG: hypothetical protein HY287_13590 [Planctomycetes bacterium]|nr:hypothetical protein [Planctomycetota bacterium]MBI3835355.1 hypothetical protein [Planctomycetota bacterium]